MAISIISQTIHMGNIKGVAMAILFVKFNLVTEQNSQKCDNKRCENFLVYSM